MFSTVGERLNYCRSLINKTRKEVSDEIQVISMPTLSRWELNTIAVPKKKFIILVNYFAKNNLFVSEEWLSSGDGSLPVNGNLEEFNEENFDDLVLKNLLSMQENVKNFWFSQVSNNFFSPIVSFGDYIGGIPLKREDFFSAQEKICFFSTDKEIFAGILKINNQDFFLENYFGKKKNIDLQITQLKLGKLEWLVKRP